MRLIVNSANIGEQRPKQKRIKLSFSSIFLEIFVKSVNQLISIVSQLIHRSPFCVSIRVT